jgi:hypothetical protein
MKNVGIYYGYLVYFTVIRYGHLVYIMVIWYTYLSRFGLLCQEKSGNPAPHRYSISRTYSLSGGTTRPRHQGDKKIDTNMLALPSHAFRRNDNFFSFLSGRVLIPLHQHQKTGDNRWLPLTAAGKNEPVQFLLHPSAIFQNSL